MPITVHYVAQIRRTLGVAQETLDAAPATVADLVRCLAAKHPPARAMLLDPEGRPSRSLLYFVNDGPLSAECPLPDGADVTILAPMAGG